MRFPSRLESILIVTIYLLMVFHKIVFIDVKKGEDNK